MFTISMADTLEGTKSSIDRLLRKTLRLIIAGLLITQDSRISTVYYYYIIIKIKNWVIIISLIINRFLYYGRGLNRTSVISLYQHDTWENLNNSET
jgi:hypothetical protein